MRVFAHLVCCGCFLVTVGCADSPQELAEHPPLAGELGGHADPHPSGMAEPGDRHLSQRPQVDEDPPAAETNGGAPSHREGETPATVDTDAAAGTGLGEAAYTKGMCGKCHGPQGTGGRRAPDLTDGQWDHCDGTVDGILAVLRQGVAKDEMVDSGRLFAMNPATNLIKDEEALQALAEFVHDLGR